MIDQTNLYAEQFLEREDIPPTSRIHEWGRSRLDLVEIKKFLAALIGMGLVNLPRLEDHWSTSWPYASGNFSSFFSRNRFSLIMRFLHLNDSAHYIPKGQPGHDPLYKIRPFMDPLLKNFKSAYQLGKEIAVDESMIGYKGRLSFIQYLPNKPTKWGMKAFVLADSISAYTWGWKIYTGKKKFIKHCK